MAKAAGRLGAASARTARSFEDADALLGAWRSLRWSRIETDPEFFRTVVESRPEVLSPHVTLVERDGRPAAMAIGRLEDAPLEFRLGYTKLAAPRMRTLTLVNGGLSDDADEGALRLLVEELLACLARGEAELLNLAKLRVGSTAHRLALELAPSLRRRRFGATSVHWRAAVPGSVEEFLKLRSAGTRKSTRYYGRRFPRDFEGRFALTRLEREDELDRLIAEMAEVNAKTYKSGLGVGIHAASPEQRGLLELAARRGLLRVHVLYVDGRPVSFWCGFRYGGGFFSWQNAYDPELADYRVGRFVMLDLLDELCSDPEVSFLDWGFGDADYKRSFSDESWLEEDVLVFGPGARGLAWNALSSGLRGVEHTVKSVAARGQIGRRVKRAWRRRLTTT